LSFVSTNSFTIIRINIDDYLAANHPSAHVIETMSFAEELYLAFMAHKGTGFVLVGG